MPDPIFAELAERRRRLGMSQRELAERAGLGTATVSRLEQGHRSATLHSARAIASVLGMALVIRPTPTVTEAGKELRPHGTAAALARHRYHRELPCADCRAWDAARKRRSRVA